MSHGRTGFLLITLAITLIFPRISSAALLTFSTKSAFDAQLINSALINTNPVKFDTSPTGSMGMNFVLNGIGFGSNGPMRISSGITSSAPNFLGYDDNMAPEFQPGDVVTLTLPAGSRGVGLNIITDTPLDILTYATLTVSGVPANTLIPGTALSGGFRSYFVGIVDDTSTISSATVTFTNAGFYRLDDVGVAMVPEPGSLLLVGAGAFLFIRRRSRIVASAKISP